jgi:outer membrane protein assembly factor BamB
LDADTGDERWQLQTQGVISGSPAVVDKTVHVASRDGTVHAIDAESGDRAWQFDVDGAVQGSPTIAHGTAFVGTNEGYLYAIDSTDEVTSSRGRWRFQTGGAIISSAAATGKHVFTASTSGNIFAILPEDGQTVWRFGFDSGVQGGPVVTDKWLYFGDTDGTVHALRSGRTA